MARSIEEKICSLPDSTFNKTQSGVVKRFKHEDSEEKGLSGQRLQTVQVKAKGSALDQPTILETMRKYATCKDWLRSLRSPATLRTYPHHMHAMLKFLSMEQGRKIDPDSFAKLRHERIRDQIFSYVLHLGEVAKKHAGKPVKGEISVNTIPTRLLGVKSWLDWNEIPAPYWKKLKGTMPPKVRNNFRSYKIEEIQKMYSLGDVFDRLNILLMTAGGERVGGQEGLTFRNIIELQVPESVTLDAGMKIGMLDVYSDSEKDHYYVPLNPEAMHQIDLVRQYRVDHGETITPDSPLIRDKFSKRRQSRKINKPKAVKSASIRQRMKKLQIEAGLPLNELQPDHSFRYFFNTALENTDCNYIIRKIMMGHKIKLDEFYYDKRSEKSRQKLIIEYLKCMDALTITAEFRLSRKIAEYETKFKDVPKLEALQGVLASKEFEMDAMKKQIIQMQTARTQERQNLQTMIQDGITKAIEEKFARLASTAQPTWSDKGRKKWADHVQQRAEEETNYFLNESPEQKAQMNTLYRELTEASKKGQAAVDELLKRKCGFFMSEKELDQALGLDEASP